jgi:hypothetical protein
MAIRQSPVIRLQANPAIANTWTADQTFNDSVKLTLGTGGDASIVFSGTDLIIKSNDVGSGAVVLQGRAFGIGAAPRGWAYIDLGGATFTSDGSSSASTAMRLEADLTGAAGDTGRLSFMNVVPNIITQTATETITDIVSVLINEPGITDNLTGDITNATTLKVANAPTEGENNYAVWVDSGSVRLDGSLWVEGTPTEGGSGEQLASGGAGAVMSWAAAGSKREWKDILGQSVTPAAALAAMTTTPVYGFKYKQPEYQTVKEPVFDEEGAPVLDARGQQKTVNAEKRINRTPSTGDWGTMYVGVMAEDAPWAMHHNGSIFNPINAFGYTVLAIQNLDARLKALE